MSQDAEKSPPKDFDLSEFNEFDSIQEYFNILLEIDAEVTSGQTEKDEVK